MEGVELAARFGSITNSLNYCGPDYFQAHFRNYLGHPSPENNLALQDSISKFEAHYAYLKLIAGCNGKQPFDYPVVEAFWLGNGLLEKIPREKMEEMMLGDLTGKGKMEAARARALADSLPGRVWPHHSFHVYFVRFITGKVEWNLHNADSCRVPFGRVEEIDEKGGATVSYRPIKFSGEKRYYFGEETEKGISLNLNGIGMAPDLQEGDWAAFHWGVAVKKLSAGEMENLKKYTQKSLELANFRIQANIGEAPSHAPIR